MRALLKDGPLKGMVQDVHDQQAPRFLHVPTVLYDPIDKVSARAYNGECTYQFLKYDENGAVYQYYSQKVPLGQKGKVVTFDDLADISEGAQPPAV